MMKWAVMVLAVMISLLFVLTAGFAQETAGGGSVLDMVQQVEKAAKQAKEASYQAELAAQEIHNLTNGTPGAERISDAAEQLEQKAKEAGAAAQKAEEAAKNAQRVAEKLPRSGPGFGVMAAALALIAMFTSFAGRRG